MKRHLHSTNILSAFICLLIFSCTPAKKVEKPTPTLSNILLQEWEGLYGGLPHFDKMKLEDIKSAMETGWN